MLEKNGFEGAYNLDEEESPVSPNKIVSNGEHHSSDSELKDTTSSFFVVTELDGSPKGIHSQGKPTRPCSTSFCQNVPYELTEELRKKWSAKLLDKAATALTRNVVIDSLKERVIIRFVAQIKNISCDIEVPLDITANDLIVGLNEAYNLGIDLSDVRQCYMSCDNPVVLIKGKRLLGEYGVRDGSLITYYR